MYQKVNVQKNLPSYMYLCFWTQWILKKFNECCNVHTVRNIYTCSQKQLIKCNLCDYIRYFTHNNNSLYVIFYTPEHESVYH